MADDPCATAAPTLCEKHTRDLLDKKIELAEWRQRHGR